MANKVLVSVIPKCDLCSNEAYADCKTTMGCWANLCMVHFKILGPEVLGTGFGQQYVKKGDTKDA